MTQFAQQQRDWDVRVSEQYIVEEGEGWAWVFDSDGHWFSLPARPHPLVWCPYRRRKSGGVPEWALWLAALLWTAISL